MVENDFLIQIAQIGHIQSSEQPLRKHSPDAIERADEHVDVFARVVHRERCANAVAGRPKRSITGCAQ